MAPTAARASTVEAPPRRLLEYASATKTLVSRTTSGLTRRRTGAVGAQVEPGADRRRGAAPLPVVPRTPLPAQRSTARFVADPGRFAAQTGSSPDPPSSGWSDRSRRTHVRPPTRTRMAVSPAKPLVPSAERWRRQRDPHARRTAPGLSSPRRLSRGANARSRGAAVHAAAAGQLLVSRGRLHSRCRCLGRQGASSQAVRVVRDTVRGRSSARKIGQRSRQASNIGPVLSSRRVSPALGDAARVCCRGWSGGEAASTRVGFDAKPSEAATARASRRDLIGLHISVPPLQATGQPGNHDHEQEERGCCWNECARDADQPDDDGEAGDNAHDDQSRQVSRPSDEWYPAVSCSSVVLAV